MCSALSESMFVNLKSVYIVLGLHVWNLRMRADSAFILEYILTCHSVNFGRLVLVHGVMLPFCQPSLSISINIEVCHLILQVLCVTCQMPTKPPISWFCIEESHVCWIKKMQTLVTILALTFGFISILPSTGKLDKGAVLKAICSGYQETTDPPVCLSDQVETNECLNNNGGCWMSGNITACKVCSANLFLGGL